MMDNLQLVLINVQIQSMFEH